LNEEQELALRLAGTAQRRRAGGERIAELAERADYTRLARILDLQLLLPLAARRLEQSAPGVAPAAFRELAERQASQWRQISRRQVEVTVSLIEALGRAEIAAVPLKGPLLAEELCGDPGMRFSSDVDLLVDATQLDSAVGVLRAQGYGPSADLPWQDGRPLLHHALPPERDGLPPLDLHWRIHWYETELSRDLLTRSVSDPRYGRRLQPADEVLSLLLFFGRNSFSGLRLAGDVAASWDLREPQLAPGFLAPVLAARPELREAVTAAAFLCDRLVGLPFERALGPDWRPGRRGCLAARLANWELSGTETERTANMVSVDWLLTPRGQWGSFARRHMFQPAEAIARSYGRPPDHTIRNEGLRMLHGGARAAKFACRHARLRWRVRRGRGWSVLPSA
jgi:hypothetical protein